MKKNFLCFAILVIAAIATVNSVSAGAVSAEKQAGISGRAESVQDINQPPQWIKWGGDLRLRLIREGAGKLDKNKKGNDRFWQRHRARVWTEMNLAEDIDFNMRLITEPRYYCHRDDIDDKLIREDVFFDRLNMRLKNVFDMPMTAIIGRQDLVLGSGWLVCEGTPLDGSRSAYFDAVRLTYSFDRKDTTADLIWINNYADSAKYIRPFNDQNLDMMEQDERGAILYLSDKSVKSRQIDGYFIYKNDHNRNRSNGSEGEIYTIGTMLQGDIDNNWRYRVELAPQFGHKNGKELGAFATNNRLSYCFKDEKENTVFAGYEYLSGNDDPEKNFDKLWGRDAQWSDLYNGSIDTIDGRELDSSNLHRPNFGWSFKPAKKFEIITEYSLLFADTHTNAAGTNGLSEEGFFRGQLIKNQLKYKFNDNVQTRFTTELFFPGDYYTDARNDVAFFFQYELVFRW